jgi:hypothetical protein
MRNWLPLLMLLALLLAACGDDSTPPPGPTNTPSVTEAADEPAEGFELEPREPGLRARKGLTVLAYNEGVQENTGYFFAEVRNDSNQVLTHVDAVIYALDKDGFKLSEASANPLISDIPPGQVFYVGQSFALPDGYAASQHWLWYTPADEPRLQGVFNLPASVTSQSIDENGIYTVEGTARNTAAADLRFPVITVLLIGPDEALVGLAHAVVSTGRDDGVWPAGAEASFAVQFPFISVSPELLSGVRMLAAGYIVP